jgi:hypothetical protein
MFYYPIVVAVLTLLSQGNLTHVTILYTVIIPMSVFSVTPKLQTLYGNIIGCCITEKYKGQSITMHI